MKVLVIGQGSIGRRHAEILAELEAVDRVEVVSRRGCEDFDCYHDLSELEGKWDHDYVVICSETHLHREHLLAVNENLKDKLIAVEKPLFEKSFELPTMSNRVFVTYQLRHHPIVQKVASLTKGKQIYSAHINTSQYLPDWRPNRDYRETYSAQAARGGGALLDISHELDYFLWLFGPVAKFESMCSKVSDLEIDVEDNASVIGTTASGVPFSITMDYLSKIPQRSILVHFESGTIRADMFKGSFEFVAHDHEENFDFSNIDRNLTYREMHMDHLSEKPRIACSLEEGMTVMRWIDDIKHG